jgi:hypothetical protein
MKTKYTVWATGILLITSPVVHGDQLLKKTNSNYPSPESGEQIGTYRERLKKLGMDVGGSSKKTGDGCVEIKDSVIFHHGNVESLAPLGIKLMLRESEGYIAQLRKKGRSGVSKEYVGFSFATITRDVRGNLLKLIEETEGERGGNTNMDISWSREGKLLKVKLDGGGGDGSWSGEIELDKAKNVTVTLSSTQC